ncbi:MAG: protein phosphatase 2C domain-containing protein [Cyanobacteria bacterium J06650_10]
MNSKILCIDIEASPGNGEDCHLIIGDDDDIEFVVLGVFDGLGGRSAGFENRTGGQIASCQAARITESVIRQRGGAIASETISEMQSTICDKLKSDAESKMSKSRLSGTLTGKRLCTTMVVASVPKIQGKVEEPFEIKLAWIGDSRAYFLSPDKGLQQLTVDDLEIEKDAFEMIREDPRMSQYLTADIPNDWIMHFSVKTISQRGCLVVCTDGCFQYISTPWDFERLLIETLSITESLEKWQGLLHEKYESIKQDDTSLLLYPIGFENFSELSKSYQERTNSLSTLYDSDSYNGSLDNLWEIYRGDYEARLDEGVIEVTRSSTQIIEDDCLSDVASNHYIKANNIDVGNHSSDPEKAEAEGNIECDSSGSTGVWGLDSTTNPIPRKKTDSNLPEKGSDSHEQKKFIDETKSLLRQALKNRWPEQLSEAIKRFEQVLIEEPDNLDSNFELGYAYFKLHEFENSIRHFHKAMNASAGNREYYIDSLHFLAEAHYKIEDYKSSLVWFEELKERVGYHNIRDEYMLEHYADVLCRASRFQNSINLCEDTLLLRNPDNPFAHYLIGYNLHHLCLLRKAKYYLERAVDLYYQRYLWWNSQAAQSMMNQAQDELEIVNRKIDGYY